MTTGPDTFSDEARCDRYEREALLAKQRGEPLDDHFETCTDCRSAAAAHRDLSDLLRREGQDLRPPDHWQAGVWTAIDQRRERRRRRRSPVWLLLPVAFILAVLLGQDLIFPPRDAKPLAGLEMTLIDGESVRRGVDARPGDVLRLRAPLNQANGATDLLLYRNDRHLVFRCRAHDGAVEPTGASIGASESELDGSCTLADDVLTVTVELAGRGRYQALWVRGDHPLPDVGGAGLDPVAALFLDAGAEIELSEPVTVR